MVLKLWVAYLCKKNKSMKWEEDTYIFQMFQGEMNLMVNGMELKTESPLVYEVNASKGKEAAVYEARFTEKDIAVYQADALVQSLALSVIDEWVDEEAEALGFMFDDDEE
ncbi:hypothetical protein PEDI_12940 [Persicobacter diffluens]|uniref:Uncharacterized protein n=2 Tax=Persicobacter diffluens TaxID=981 RepID=A0AAN4VWJ7_9BACT|nr:hypothetical protein PEDI_12940 [Persicobacter diffluens]